MIRHIVTIFLLLLGWYSFAQQKDTINWLSFEQLSDSLTTNPKKVLLFFHTDWCAYCRKMQHDVFTDPKIVNRLNRYYYAVRFDAESVDSVHFDGQIIVNEAQRKRTGEYHDMAKLLATRQGELTFPTTLILGPDFTVQQRYFQYLDRRKLLRIL